jgi:hypothetical protein
MIKPEQIPDEVAKAADAAYYDTAADPRWSDEHLMKTAIAAALNAWPNAKTLRDDGRRQTYVVPAIILPLPQEAP